MLKKRTEENTLREFVERNTGMPIHEFLNPCVDPFIYGLAEAVSFVKGYRGKVTIIGDYDADGITASAIMYRGLKRYGFDPFVRLPKRFSEGYGLSEHLVEEAAEWMDIVSGIDEGLIITVDNGIAAYEAVEMAKRKGLDVIVTDHHLPRVEDGKVKLPPADFIVDPNAEDRSGFSGYCGAAIAYRFIQSLLPGADLTDELVLASIATVTDIMPLVGANRALLIRGLGAINSGRGPKGLRALINVMELSHIDEEDYGFSIGPVFNAASRLHDDGAKDVLHILITDDYRQEEVLALVQNNEVRKKVTRDAMAAAEGMLDGTRPIVLCIPGIGEGVIGLVAGRLCEKYRCPAIVFTEASDGSLKGSGRSIPEIHLKDALDRMQGLMLKYGGHAAAAGLSIRKDGFRAFADEFRRQCGEMPEVSGDVEYDFRIRPEQVPAVMAELAKYAPYGNGNPNPVFRMCIAAPKGTYRAIGKDFGSFLVKCRGFDAVGLGLNDRYLGLGTPAQFEGVGHLKKNWFRNRAYNKFMLDDICLG